LSVGEIALYIGAGIFIAFALLLIGVSVGRMIEFHWYEGFIERGEECKRLHNRCSELRLELNKSVRRVSELESRLKN
jgi:hypothetical protein